MPITRHLVNQQHTHRFVVTSAPEGWDVSEESDEAVLSHVHRRDWHRVEMDILLFELRALGLKRAGWIEPQPAASR